MYIMSQYSDKGVIKAQAYSCVECSTLHVHKLSTIFMEVKGVGGGGMGAVDVLDRFIEDSCSK